MLPSSPAGTECSQSQRAYDVAASPFRQAPQQMDRAAYMATVTFCFESCSAQYAHLWAPSAPSTCFSLAGVHVQTYTYTASQDFAALVPCKGERRR